MPATFDDLFRTEYPQLVPMLHAVLGDRAGAEDVAQDALLAAQRAWRTIGAYDLPGAWVRRVALNRASNVRRRTRRESIALGRLVPAPHASHAVHVDDPADRRLWELVRRLPERQHQAVALRYVEDRSVAEIAEILRCSPGSVKTHLSRARATLARQLAAWPDELPAPTPGTRPDERRLPHGSDPSTGSVAATTTAPSGAATSGGLHGSRTVATSCRTEPCCPAPIGHVTGHQQRAR